MHTPGGRLSLSQRTLAGGRGRADRATPRHAPAARAPACPPGLCHAAALALHVCWWSVPWGCPCIGRGGRAHTPPRGPVPPDFCRPSLLRFRSCRLPGRRARRPTAQQPHAARPMPVGGRQPRLAGAARVACAAEPAGRGADANPQGAPGLLWVCAADSLYLARQLGACDTPSSDHALNDKPRRHSAVKEPLALFFARPHRQRAPIVPMRGWQLHATLTLQTAGKATPLDHLARLL